MPRPRVDRHAVFLNVPFDAKYEEQFLALVSSIVALGRIPRCVLEIPETGRGRLHRIVQLIRRCAFSVHDLSRVGTPVRFNMPFELGLAYAIMRESGSHQFALLERVPFRLGLTLSDLGGIEPLIHNGSVRGTIACILDVLRSRRDDPDPEAVYRMYTSLSQVAVERRRTYGKRTVYTRSIFLDLVAAALELP